MMDRDDTDIVVADALAVIGKNEPVMTSHSMDVHKNRQYDYSWSYTVKWVGDDKDVSSDITYRGNEEQYGSTDVEVDTEKVLQKRNTVMNRRSYYPGQPVYLGHHTPVGYREEPKEVYEIAASYGNKELSLEVAYRGGRETDD